MQGVILPKKQPPVASDEVAEDARGYRVSLGARFETLLDSFSSRLEAARVARISVDQLASYVAGNSKIPLEVIMRLARAKNASIDWLATGIGSQFAPPSEDRNYGAVPEAVIGMDELVSIPFYDASAGAGAGRAARDEAYIARLSIARDWLVAWDVNPGHAKLLTASGRSMEPTICDGDILLIDASLGSLRDPIYPIRRDAVYVIRREGDLIVKRLVRHADGSITLISDNPESREEKLSPADAAELSIMGVFA